MMKNLLVILTLLFLFCIDGQQAHAGNLDNAVEREAQDTLYTQLRHDLVVLSSTKETNSLKSLPAAVSILSPLNLKSLQVHSLKDLSAFVPNFFIPNYGSKMTTPLYIRGVGARTGTQTVSMYVDNIPYFNTTSFDTELYDIQRIEALRGTQGALYGRNAMGGILNIYTYSPINYKGTSAALSAGNYGYLSGNLSHYQSLGDNMGFSVSGYYKEDDGFFENSYTGKKADASKNVGGRVKFAWNITPRWFAQLSSSFDYTDQDAFPYIKMGEDKVSMNSPSSYNRTLLTNGLSLKYAGDKFEFNSTTGYQYLDDNMHMDQDLTAYPIFTINQIQKQHSLSQEFTLKSNTKSNYQWSNGVYGFYDNQKTLPPVHMLEDGIKMILQAQMDRLHQTVPSFPTITYTDTDMLMDGTYKKPTYGGAIFHQSTFNNILGTKGLSFTAGLRLDYEKTKLDYSAGTIANLTIQPSGSPMIFPMKVDTTLRGNLSKDYLEILPKFILKYDINPNSFLYFSVSRGYKAGGYNIQGFADILSDVLKNKIMNYRTPDKEPKIDVESIIDYDPEYTWNYEFGGQVDIVKNTLALNFSLFYIDVTDIHITDFVESGSGRITKNEGRAVSKGFELGLKARPCTGFYLYANYGFSDAKFKNEKLMNKHTSFAPESTLAVGANISKNFKNSAILDRITFDPNFTGVGKIYWTEANDLSQGFYGLFNARLAFQKGIFGLEFWGKNIFDRKYNAFYFESMSTPYVQYGKPAQYGATINVNF